MAGDNKWIFSKEELKENDLHCLLMTFHKIINIMKEIEVESQFGNLHFKLRLLSFIGNNIYDLPYKVNKKMEEFYGKGKFQKLLIMTSDT